MSHKDIEITELKVLCFVRKLSTNFGTVFRAIGYLSVIGTEIYCSFSPTALILICPNHWPS